MSLINGAKIGWAAAAKRRIHTYHSHPPSDPLKPAVRVFGVLRRLSAKFCWVSFELLKTVCRLASADRVHDSMDRPMMVQ
jgi:hypothetical protein